VNSNKEKGKIWKRAFEKIKKNKSKNNCKQVLESRCEDVAV
jgi:hypothetical protein